MPTSNDLYMYDTERGPENPKRCMLESHLPLEPGLDKGRVENTQGCKGCGGVVEQISKA